MKLHLFQDITYYGFPKPCSWCDYTALLESFSTPASRENSGNHSAEEFISAGTWGPDSDFSLENCNPAFFGITYPVGDPPAALHSFILQSGDYLFSQFRDSSSQGIRAAAADACANLHKKSWHPSGSIILLRGIREGSVWKLQLLIPLL